LLLHDFCFVCSILISMPCRVVCIYHEFHDNINLLLTFSAPSIYSGLLG
jgi:hypothetical protein